MRRILLPSLALALVPFLAASAQDSLCNPCVDPPADRIRRGDFTPTNATVIITAEDMRNLGVSSVAEIVSLLPGNTVGLPYATPDFDFSSEDPFAFLQFLRERQGERFLFTIDMPMAGWVKEEHIERLIELLDSTDPCVPVMMSVSSTIPRGSTVGREAAYLIHGYRNGRYPAALHASDGRVDDKQAILSWWASVMDQLPAE